jgi:hypothetical protein
MFVAHSASYGIIIKVRIQPQRGDTTDLQPVIVSPRWGFGFIPISLSHSLRSGLIMYHPSGAPRRSLGESWLLDFFTKFTLVG